MSYSVQFSKYGADAGARAARSLGVVDSLNLRELERMACQTALEQAGSIVEAAHLLGITRHDGVHMSVVTLDGIAVDLDELGVDPKVDQETGEADLRLGDVDLLAETMPGDWAVTVSTPMWGATWERKGPGRWVCVATNEGYA